MKRKINQAYTQTHLFLCYYEIYSLQNVSDVQIKRFETKSSKLNKRFWAYINQTTQFHKETDVVEIISSLQNLKSSVKMLLDEYPHVSYPQYRSQEIIENNVDQNVEI